MREQSNLELSFADCLRKINQEERETATTKLETGDKRGRDEW